MEDFKLFDQLDFAFVFPDPNVVHLHVLEETSCMLDSSFDIEVFCWSVRQAHCMSIDYDHSNCFCDDVGKVMSFQGTPVMEVERLYRLAFLEE